MTLNLANPGSTGTISDFVGRLRATLPLGWFPTSSSDAASLSPVLDGVLNGLACAWAFAFGLLSFTTLQTRLASASGLFLDLIANDFFGAGLIRNPGELDNSLRQRIAAGFQRQQGTRQDVNSAVISVIGIAPTICEFQNAADCGGVATSSTPGIGGGAGYGCQGLRYGSVLLAFQSLITVNEAAFFASGQTCFRPSFATFIDTHGQMQMAQPDVLRPLCQLGAVQGALVEQRGCNLIVDSRDWSGFSLPGQNAAGPVLSVVQVSQEALLSSDRVVMLSVPAGTALMGPSITLACGAGIVTASAWIRIEQAASLGALWLAASDVGHGQAVASDQANVKQVGVWQLLNVSIQLMAFAGRNLQLGLSFTGSGSEIATVLTQCWQVESGSSASSYIPTAGSIGFREADIVLPQNGTMPSSSPDPMAIYNAIASAIPAATIAWTAIAEAALP